MTFQSVSDLFAHRSDAITNEDIKHYIEGVLRALLRVDALYCDVRGLGAAVVVRVRDVVIAQQVVLLAHEIQKRGKVDLGCDVGRIRAIVE